MSAPKNGDRKFAYTTLMTKASYLAGVIVLAHTLRQHGSKWPLVVLYTKNLVGTPALKSLQLQLSRLNLMLRQCEYLVPPEHVKVNLIAERFGDTWTKLRVFGEEGLWQFDGVCYLDADMAIFNGNMDDIFSLLKDLPGDHIAANHACVCNLDHDPWAPEDWTSDNCAYSAQTYPAPLETGTEVKSDSRPTYHLLNSGLFLYRPDSGLWSRMLAFFNSSDKLGTYKFPDQDFLADFFHDKWRAIGWQWNGLKTMRYWHENIWRDDEVRCLHYIVDKPWAARIGSDGVAGYKGRDGVTHQWWWDALDDWSTQCRESGEDESVAIVTKHVAAEDGSTTDPDMQAIGSRVQSFAKNQASS